MQDSLNDETKWGGPHPMLDTFDAFMLDLDSVIPVTHKPQWNGPKSFPVSSSPVSTCVMCQNKLRFTKMNAFGKFEHLHFTELSVEKKFTVWHFLVSGLCDEDHVIYQLLCCFNIGIQSSLVGNKSHSPANADRIIITKFGRGHVWRSYRIELYI